jgi:pyridoxine 5-phosphate synthase
MVGIALEIKPERVVLVPELHEDAPADKGMDLIVRGKDIYETVDTLHANGINVSVCIAPQPEQAKLAHQLRVNWIQIHAGQLRAARTPAAQRQEFDTIIDTIKMAHKLRLRIAIGHGLDYALLKLFKGVPEIDEFSMGQGIVARALLVGMGEAVHEAQTLLRHL